MASQNIGSDKIATQSRQMGLTLVELLVAIAVLAIIAALGWRGLDSILRARIALTSELEQARGIQLAFAQLQSDCSHMVSAAALPNRIPIQVGSGRITLVRTVLADNQPPRLQVIAYRVRDGRLTRRESAVTRDLNELDQMWQAYMNDMDPASSDTSGVVLQSGVADLTMRIWFKDRWQADMPPVPAGVNPAMPAGLEVSSRLQGREGSLLKIFLLGAG